MPSIADRKRAFKRAFKKAAMLTEPYDIWPNDAEEMPPFPFPYLHHRHADWILVQTYKVYSDNLTSHYSKKTYTQMTFAREIIKVGMGYAFITRGPLYNVIGEYRHVTK